MISLIIEGKQIYRLLFFLLMAVHEIPRQVPIWELDRLEVNLDTNV